MRSKHCMACRYHLGEPACDRRCAFAGRALGMGGRRGHRNGGPIVPRLPWLPAGRPSAIRDDGAVSISRVVVRVGVTGPQRAGPRTHEELSMRSITATTFITLD